MIAALRPALVLLAALLNACAWRASEERAPSPRLPSLILVSIDTLRADRLGCYGSQTAETPQLDAWAREGVLFEQALTPVPITLPSHSTMLTGLFPHRHGVRDNGLYRLPPEPVTLAAHLAAAGYDTGAVVASAVLDRHYGLDRGFRIYDDAVGAQGGLAISERNASAVTTAALAAARQLQRPFFLFVHYFDPHAVYQPPPPFSERFRDRPYDGEVAFVDSELGRLRRELAALGLLEGSLVAATADHGESLGAHGEATHGVFLYQTTLRVPLIVVAPGRLPAGQRVAGLASTVDLFPTFVDLLGLKAPPGLDGRSLVPLARGASATPRFLPLESEFGYNSYGWSPLVGLSDGQLKWIGAPQPELYDLEVDPAESRDLAATKTEALDRLSTLWRKAVREDRRGNAVPDASDQERAERLARLQALGYVAGSKAPAADGAKLPDPKRVIGTLALVNDARQLIGERRFARALEKLAAARRVSPRNVSALTLSGIALLSAGKPRLAVLSLSRAAEIAPANADVAFNLGLAYLASNDAAGAEQAWRRTLALSPRFSDAAVNLIDLLIQTDRNAEAQTALEAARQAGIEGPLLDFLAGKLAHLRGDAAQARSALAKAVKSGALPPAAVEQARQMLASIG